MLAAIQRLDHKKIKGLGPAAANLLYFVHPTMAPPPSNTAIVKGLNAIVGAKMKLGSWSFGALKVPVTEQPRHWARAIVSSHKK